ncbi:MAG TPA: hypothetical protein VFW78_05255 [Bacteroidia bacterium]|nr:hypothetical protein [Bacteroidia bacterium]
MSTPNFSTRGDKKILRSVLAVTALFLMVQFSFAQGRLDTPIRLKIENGKTDDVSVVLKNLTTGETNSVNGEAKFNLSLKLNCDYIISFNKPGYVTKRIQVNTTIPAERARQGLYPFPFDVYLFKQYEGVNIIVFNQPVGKISYDRNMDEFDYDTDYTKQIQSQIKEAEEQSKTMAAKEAEKSKEDEKEAARLKKVMDAEAKEAAKAKEAEDKKALADAKANEDAKKAADKLALEEQKNELRAQRDADRKAKSDAKHAEEMNRIQKGAAGSESQSALAHSNDADKSKSTIGASDNEPFASVVQTASNEDPTPPGGYQGEGSEDLVISNANGYLFSEPGPEKAVASVFQEQPASNASKATSGSVSGNNETVYEVMPEVHVEQIAEINRMVTLVTVKKSDDAVVYRRVVYPWGGVYFFKNDLSISESFFLMATAQR